MSNVAAMKVLAIADPLASLHIQTDTTLILCREAKKRGMEVYYCLKNQLSLTGDGAIATASTISLDEPTPTLTGKPVTMPLAEFAVALMRQDPPFDMGYYSAARILAAANIPVVNEPLAVINEPEKLLPFRFPQFCPPSLVSWELSRLVAFFGEHPQGLVLKPLYGYGGRDVVAVTNLAELESAARELLAAGLPIVAQELLTRVKTHGDRRCFTLDGEFVGGFARIPPKGELVANLARGGAAEECDFTAGEVEICKTVANYLKEVGILFAGLDLIDEKLIEVNVTSPTGLREHKQLGGVRLEAKIWDIILKML